MRKLLFTISLVIISILTFGQFPNPQGGLPGGLPIKQYLGNDSTLIGVKGVEWSKYGFVNGIFSDTIQANLTRIRQYPGAQIFTYKPASLDSGSVWIRNFNATKWLRGSGSVGITSFNFLNDSTVIICFGNGICDTVSLTNTVNNSITNIYDNSYVGYTLNGDSCVTLFTGSGATTVVCSDIVGLIAQTFQFINDSTGLICGTIPPDSTVVCDTVHFPSHPIYIFQNGLTQYPGIVEWGGELLHNTTVNTKYSTVTFTGVPLFNYTANFINELPFSQGTGVSSFWSLGGAAASEPDWHNTVKAAINYTGGIIGFNGSDTIPGLFGRNMGYMFNVNGTGASTNGFNSILKTDNIQSKIGGIFIHTLDTSNNNSLSIFGAKPPLTTNENRLDTSVIADFNYDKSLKLYGYPNTRNDAVTNKALYTDANGDVKYGTIAGTASVEVHDTTVIICSFGTELCDTNYFSNVGVIQNVFLYHDTLVVCGSITCDTAIISGLGGLFGVQDNSAFQNRSFNYHHNYTFLYDSVKKMDYRTYGSFGKVYRMIFDKDSSFYINNNDGAYTTEIFTRPSNGFTATTKDNGNLSTGIVSASSNDSHLELVVGGVSTTGLLNYWDGSSEPYSLLAARNPFVGMYLDGLDGISIGKGTSVNGIPLRGLRIKPDWQIYMDSIDRSTSTTWVNAFDSATGKVTYIRTDALGYISTADNGLTANTATNVQLGATASGANSPLLHNSFINTTANYYLEVNGSVPNSTAQGIFRVFNTSGSFNYAARISSTNGVGTYTSGTTGIYATGTITGVQGESTNGVATRGDDLGAGAGVVGTSIDGNGGVFSVNPSSTNTISEVMQIVRHTSGTAANGIGGSLVFYNTVDDGSTPLSNQLISKLTTAALATRTSQFIITTVNSGATQDAERINGNGTFQWPQYGAGAATFDASGNITSVSDIRYKDIQGSYRAGIREIMNISPIIYKWNKKSGLEMEHNYIGFSAQNIRDVLGNDAVGVNKDGYLSLQDRAILAALTNGEKDLYKIIQEQQKEIEDLKKLILLKK